MSIIFNIFFSRSLLYFPLPPCVSAHHIYNIFAAAVPATYHSYLHNLTFVQCDSEGDDDKVSNKELFFIPFICYVYIEYGVLYSYGFVRNDMNEVREKMKNPTKNPRNETF